MLPVYRLGRIQGVTTVSTEAELDALPKGQKVKFTVSGAVCTKVAGGLWTVEGVKGAQMPGDLCLNGTPMELLKD